jgi:integrase
MSVKRRGNSFEVRWLDENKTHKSKSFKVKDFGGVAEARAQAEAFEVSVKADLLRGEYIDPHRNKISFSDFKDEVGLTRGTQKESTKRTLEDCWESRVAPYPIANKPLANIGALDIANHLRDIRKSNGEEYSRSALNQTLEVIRVLLDSAYEMELIKKNPAKTKLAKKYLPKAKKPEHIYLSLFQVKQLEKQIAKTHPAYANIIPLLSFTGLRSGEFRALTWDDIDFDNSTISINKSIDDNNNMEIKENDAKTDKSIRTIAVDSITLSKLKEQRELYSTPDCEWVFPNMRGNQNGTQVLCTNPIRARNFKRRILQPAVEELGLSKNINLHTFRHTSVYLAVLGGADILSISKRLGHASIVITANTYSDLFEETDLKVVQGLESLQLSELSGSARSSEVG